MAMALFRITILSPFISSSSLIGNRRISSSPSRILCCSKLPSNRIDDSNDANSNEDKSRAKRISQQSSWEAKDSQGRDYLYRLGPEADNMNIAVGARSGVIDDLFAGNFLGRDSDIVFDYRQKVTRSFEYLQGDYYIAPLFMKIIKEFREKVKEEEKEKEARQATETKQLAA
ncbi:uncharacterized protein LOC110814918 [Carica papaya]|uniref:uncharacterized protein LOC110814918 n=1 Tax=Carica papaya TaxID=3649 RepID=UPI000B8CF011|nr:uncharacterized protein LOC110814918 [Carica papaya]